MNARTPLICVLVLWSLTAPTAWGIDLVYQVSSNTRLQGEVTDISKNGIKFKPRTGDAVDIPADDILQIEWTGEPAALKTGRAHETGGRYTQALEAYAKAEADNKSEAEGLKTDLAFFMARAQARLALGDPTKIDDAIKKLRDFQSKHANSYHAYACAKLLGDLYLAQKNFAEAEKAYTTLSQAPFNSYKMDGQLGLARRNLLENKVAEAQSQFEAVTRSTPKNPSEASRVQSAQLGLATCLQLQKNYAEALKLLDEVVAKASPDDAAVQAEAYLRQGDCLQASGKPKEALLAYLHVDLLFPSQKALHAEALFHLAKLWEKVQQPDRAADAADRLQTDYPHSEWAKQAKSGAGQG